MYTKSFLVRAAWLALTTLVVSILGAQSVRLASAQVQATDTPGSGGGQAYITNTFEG